MDDSPGTQHSKGFALSIRAKLFLINAMLLIFVGLYGFVEHSSLERLQSLEHAASQNLASEVDLLMLRRHEKTSWHVKTLSTLSDSIQRLIK